MSPLPIPVRRVFGTLRQPEFCVVCSTYLAPGTRVAAIAGEGGVYCPAHTPSAPVDGAYTIPTWTEKQIPLS